MKLLITFAAVLLMSAAVAQSTDVSTISDDNGKRLLLIIDAKTPKGKIEYKNEFDVRGMSQEQKDRVIDRIKDSLGIDRSAKPQRVVKNFSDNDGMRKAELKPGADGRSELKEKAEELMTKMMTRFNGGDASGVAEFYAENGMIYHPGKTYIGKDAIARYWKNAGAGKWKLTIKEAGGNKTSFWASGLSDLTVSRNGTDRTFSNNFIIVVQRDGSGEYKIYKDIYNAAGDTEL